MADLLLYYTQKLAGQVEPAHEQSKNFHLVLTVLIDIFFDAG